MIEEKERTRMKADYFARNSIPIHLKKHNGEWLNGWIASLQDEYLILDEYKRGNVQVFLVDIRDIVAFEPLEQNKEEKRDGNKRA